MKTQGYSLIELTIVLVIMGILLSTFTWNALRGVRATELRDAAAEIATDFRQARSLAQKGSTDITISWTPNGSQAFTQYTVNGVVKTVPGRIILTCTVGCGSTVEANTLTYTAPYGEVASPVGKVITLTSPVSNLSPIRIRVVGTTGKVVVNQGTL